MSRVASPAHRRIPARPNGVGATERVVEALWGFWSSPRLAVAVILGIALLCLAGVALPQSAAGLLASPAAGAAPVALRPLPGFVVGFLSSLGLLDVGSSLALRILLVALALNTFICTANRAPSILRTVFRPTATASKGIVAGADLRVSLTLHSTDPLGALAFALRKHGYRVVPTAGGTGTGVYADRFRFGRLGTLVSHAAIILILIGALVGSIFGLRGPSLAVPVGEVGALWPGSDLSARVDRFAEEHHPGGQVRSYVAEITLLERGFEVARQTVRIGEPLRYGGVALNLGRPGPAASLVVRDAGGRAVAAETLALDDESSGSPRATLELGESELLATISRSVDTGSLRLDVYGLVDSRPRGSADLTVGQSSTVAGLTWLLVEERPYATLQATRDPGAPLIWFAGVLLVCGMAVALYLPHRQFWATVSSTGPFPVAPAVRRRSRSEGAFVVSVVGRSRRDDGLARDWSKIAGELNEPTRPLPARSPNRHHQE